ncbi:MAG: cupin domain-containing protein [Deltaproteobacteria bacterium]|nr:cupin domain-containing protein [Deltaproteobacteria bacterium]
MNVRNIAETEYFIAADGAKITETFGIPTTKTREGSVAYAIIPPKVKLYTHKHTFEEWYVITKGKGLMELADETQKVGPGDNIYIKRGTWHSIENIAEREPLELYCFCTPAYTVDGTIFKDGVQRRENIERDFG